MGTDRKREKRVPSDREGEVIHCIFGLRLISSIGGIVVVLVRGGGREGGHGKCT